MPITITISCTLITPAQFDDDFIAAGLVVADFDRDGDLDLIQTTSEGGPLRLLRNSSPGGMQTSYTNLPANQVYSITLE